jgi:hypothetical protein
MSLVLSIQSGPPKRLFVKTNTHTLPEGDINTHPAALAGSPAHGLGTAPHAGFLSKPPQGVELAFDLVAFSISS